MKSNKAILIYCVVGLSCAHWITASEGIVPHEPPASDRYLTILEMVDVCGLDGTIAQRRFDCVKLEGSMRSFRPNLSGN